MLYEFRALFYHEICVFMIHDIEMYEYSYVSDELDEYSMQNIDLILE